METEKTLSRGNKVFMSLFFESYPLQWLKYQQGNINFGNHDDEVISITYSYKRLSYFYPGFSVNNRAVTLVNSKFT